jgi:uncharacterized protein YaaW (UPF0174 family)
VAASENKNQITIPATDIEGAAALVTAIANHSILKQIVYGVSDGVDTVTVYSVLPGPIGEAITLAEAGNGITLGGAVLEGITSTALATYKDYGMGAV